MRDGLQVELKEIQLRSDSVAVDHQLVALQYLARARQYHRYQAIHQTPWSWTLHH